MAEAGADAATVMPAFVELPMAELVDDAPAKACAVIEMHDGNGRRVVVRLARDAPADVAQVVAALLGRRA